MRMGGGKLVRIDTLRLIHTAWYQRNSVHGPPQESAGAGSQLRGDKTRYYDVVGYGEHWRLVAQKGNNQTPKTRNGMILILSPEFLIKSSILREATTSR